MTTDVRLPPCKRCYHTSSYHAHVMPGAGSFCGRFNCHCTAYLAPTRWLRIKHWLQDFGR